MTKLVSMLGATGCLVLGLGACSSGDDGGAATGDAQNFTENKLRYDEWKVLFTNPECKEYKYETPVESNSGEMLEAKPKNVFCSKSDSKASGARPESPQYQLLEWINDPETKEIFFTYLSYSNSAVTRALCSAVEDRGVRINFIIDNTSDTAKAEELKACTAQDGSHPEYQVRGHEGGIGYAHNKLFMVNPTESGTDKVKFAFSSGNLTSGVVLHHENWHFITLSKDTYFAQAHLCMMQAELDHHGSKQEYKDALRACRSNIEAPEETDVHVYFAPAEGKDASKALVSAISRAEKIDVAGHRFSYTTMLNALKSRLSNDGIPMRVVLDDDVYWAGKGEVVGDNNNSESYQAHQIEKLGGEVRYMQTNHGEHLLHHSKYLIFDMPDGQPDAFFGGAGNLTGTAFNENWENFYYITIPEVVEAMQKQYTHVWDDLASKEEDLPSENILPPTEGL